MKYPYTDDFMRYDLNSHRYVLTAKCVKTELGINLETEFKTDIKNSINAFLLLVSQQTYNIIHNYSANNDMQDYIIAKTESGRKMIKEAMEFRLLYMLTREEMHSEALESTILRSLPEIGTTICYAGRLQYCSCDKSEW